MRRLYCEKIYIIYCVYNIYKYMCMYYYDLNRTVWLEIDGHLFFKTNIGNNVDSLIYFKGSESDTQFYGSVDLLFIKLRVLIICRLHGLKS